MILKYIYLFITTPYHKYLYSISNINVYAILEYTLQYHAKSVCIKDHTTSDSRIGLSYPSILFLHSELSFARTRKRAAECLRTRQRALSRSNKLRFWVIEKDRLIWKFDAVDKCGSTLYQVYLYWDYSKATRMVLSAK